MSMTLTELQRKASRLADVQKWLAGIEAAMKKFGTAGNSAPQLNFWGVYVSPTEEVAKMIFANQMDIYKKEMAQLQRELNIQE